MISLETRSPETPAPNNGRMLVWVYGAWSFLASLLLFWVELMVAKMLLPGFGGSPSVWNTALVFFQLNLLAGYAAAHFLARFDSSKHKVIQSVLVILPAFTLPVALPAFLDTQELAPVVAVLVALTLMVGAPFFALATSTPTLQAWFSHSSHPKALDPYFLYALSNIGSVVGLLGYPLLIEPSLTLHTQTILWSVGYGLFALLTVAGSRLVGRWSRPVQTKAERPAWSRRLRWAALAFVPSLGLLGVTRHLSTDVAAFPLMWTIPLALYLASFVVTFRSGGERWGEMGARATRLLVVPAALIALVPSVLWLSVTVPLLLLTAVAIAAHGLVYKDRPAAGSLTDFYLWVSIGGAAGGLFASLFAPSVFDFIVEYPLMLVLSALLVGPPLRRHGPSRPVVLVTALTALIAGAFVGSVEAQLLIFGVVGVMGILWLTRTWFAATIAGMVIGLSFGATTDVLATERTFFGVYRVHEADDYRFLMSGTTFHGMQLRLAGETMSPVSYYHPDGPIGDVIEAAGADELDIGIVGLGVGGLTGYGQAGDRIVYYEIDQVVEDIARNSDFFTFLSDSDAEVDVVIGDGRLQLERLGTQHDLLFIDAFSSDAIPVHLLTLQAFETYLESLSTDGAVVVHISNRHFDLEPVVGRIAEELGVSAHIKRYTANSDQEWASASTWIVVEPEARLELGDDWVDAGTDGDLWTDDYSNILSVLNWD